MRVEPANPTASSTGTGHAPSTRTVEDTTANRDQQIEAAYNRIKAAFEKATKP